MRFFSFYSSLNLIHSSSPKPQNIEIKFFCKVVQLQTQFCLLKYFGATLLETPQNRTPKLNFLKMNRMKTVQTRALVFLISADT